MESTKFDILNAIAKMLRPLVRLLLKYQISYGEFSSFVRRIYVEVAYSDFTIPKRKTTYSKVAVMTGIDRKMVQEIINNKKDVLEEQAKPINKGLSVVKEWTTSRKYLDKNKKPLELPLRGKKSFETLVAQSCADLTARSVLDELVRSDVVVKTEDNTVRLVKTAYVPTGDEKQLVNVVFTCARDLLLTGEHNIENDADNLWFQRQVAYSNIPVSEIDEFKQLSDTKSEELIGEMNRWLHDKNIGDKSDFDEQTKRVGVGIYYIEIENGE